MQLKDIMARKVATIDGDDSIFSAARLMRTSNVGCLVVTNAGNVKGIITDRDLATACLSEGHDSRLCQVAGHMSNPVITGSPSMDILDAAHLMTEKRVKRLPVVEGTKLVGLVSMSDIAQAMDRTMHDLLFGMGAARRAA
jgi:CBS domain-containing protein